MRSISSHEQKLKQVTKALWDIWLDKEGADLKRSLPSAGTRYGRGFREEIDALLFAARFHVLMVENVIELEQQGLGRLEHIDKAIWECRLSLLGSNCAGVCPSLLVRHGP
jgi:hypothetical protein